MYQFLITQEEKPHIDFLELRGYEPQNQSKTIYIKKNIDIESIYHQNSLEKSKIIIKRNNYTIYDGEYPFNISEFAHILFGKLKIL
jgi:hypothetical protein